MLESLHKLDLVGTKRSRPFKATWGLLQPQLGRFGITRVADVTGLDRLGIPVVMVCRPNSRSLAVSQGKGLTLEAAKCSALMECIELFHGEHIELPLRLASAAQLARSVPLADIEGLASARNSRFHPSRELLWIEATDLGTDEPRWLPFEVVHCSAKMPPPTGSGCFQSTSNGLASGNCVQEAVVHALSEVIERDATTLWEARSAHGKAGSIVDVCTIQSEPILGLLARLKQRRFELVLFDTTSDVGVPSFLAEIEDLEADSQTPHRYFTGMGCHPTREVAALRAITEAAQCRLTLISGARDDLFRDAYRQRSHKSYSEQTSGLSAARVSFGTIPDFDSPAFSQDIAWMLERLAACGLKQVLLVDLSLPGTGIAVARVVVPGLEGPDDDPDYVPGVRALRNRRQ
jgi:YcaO-like protein with predicted kinase domain